MSRVILYMAMSLDGFITGPDDDKENPAGVGGMRLMEWLGGGGPEVADWRPGDPQSQIVFDELMSTGAVFTGRRTGDFAGYWAVIITAVCRSSSRPIPLRRTIATSGCIL
jgi:dihydrofolate reductase